MDASVNYFELNILNYCLWHCTIFQCTCSKQYSF